MKCRHASVLALFLLIFTAAPLAAETHFVRGYSDGLRTYAVISRNGSEYRTDELGARVNAKIWLELSDADRRALLKAYGWDLASRADHFGSTSTDMATWINDQQGWTAAAEALKSRHANKAFPTLAPVFGPGNTTLADVWSVSCANPEIANSAEYKEALRLQREIQNDYAVGKQVYDMLVNAKWEEVSIATKALSEPLIKIILDNFITGFVTNGAAKTSELAAQAYQFANDLKDFIAGRTQTGSTPPTPIELINRLEKYITDMETTADTAVSLINQKKQRLSDLATLLKQRDEDKTKAKQDAAKAVRDALQTRTSTIPGAAAPPTFTPTNPEGTPAEQQENVRVQMEAWLDSNVNIPKRALETAKNTRVSEVSGRYSPIIAQAGNVYYEGAGYTADATDGFTQPYYEVMDEVASVQTWVATSIPNAIKQLNDSRTGLDGASAAVNGAVDDLLPQVNTLQARVLGMNAYESILGYKPSNLYGFDSLLNFDPLIDIAATTDRTVEDLQTQLASSRDIADEIRTALPTGIDKRTSWMRDEVRRYDSLKFNFENSLSYVIAGIRQVERLHTHPYFKKQATAVVCYGAACVYRYDVDVASINASIAAIADPVARARARQHAVDELIRLKNEESQIIRRIEIAQNSHTNDVAEMQNFWDAIGARYLSPDLTKIIDEFASVTGTRMQLQGDLWNALAPDITWYFVGDGSWIRNRSNLTAAWADPWGDYMGPVVDLVSGKIPEYWELLDIYRSMGVNKSYYLGMSTTDFDAFMTSTTQKIGQSPTGTYVTAFQMAHVYGVEWPCWQLLMKTQWRQEALNSEYRFHYQMTPVAWDIDGFVGTSGAASGTNASTLAVAEPEAAGGGGLPDVTVVLSGYLTTATKTATDGSFRFEWIGSGNFSLSPSGHGYQYPASATQLTMTQQNATVTINASETAASGYSIAGTVKDGASAAVTGASIALTSTTGNTQTVVTGPDGSYRFFGLAPGTWSIQPVRGDWSFSPSGRSVTIAQSVNAQDFIATAAAGSSTGLAVVLGGRGAGRVTSSPAGIDCPGTCWAPFASGTTVALNAIAQSGSALAMWQGRCSGSAGCSVLIGTAASVTAIFNSTAPPDAIAPAITTFTLPAAASSGTVPLTFTAFDNVAVTGYLATMDSAAPTAADARWQPAAPASLTFAEAGTKIVYGWAKDAAGNVSEPANAAITVSSLASTKGDANGDGGVTVGDVFYLIRYLFASGGTPVASADVNGDGVTTAADVFYLINYLFAGGPAPK